jgi:hypothetical protein
MYIKIFEYGHNWEVVLAFIEWWIKSENFSRDVKKGDKIDGHKAIRDIDHTIRIIQKNKFELIIEKGFILSDGPPRELEDEELYLNKWFFFSGNGFNRSIRKIRKWLEETWDCNPCLINFQKAIIEELKFDMVGVGFFIEVYNGNKFKLRIVADVVGIPK